MPELTARRSGTPPDSSLGRALGRAIGRAIGRWLVGVFVLVILLGAGRSPDAAARAPDWEWPTSGDHAVLRPFVAPPTPYGAGHRGVDLLSAGTALAPADGVVHFAGTVVDRPVLSIRHADGLLSSYEPVSTELRRGDAVARGQPVGTVEEGHCARLCVHFGVRLDGEYLNPLLLLGEVPRSVLLPTR